MDTVFTISHPGRAEQHLIVGGVGVANAVQAFLETKNNVIASFKCLGAPAGFRVPNLILVQILILASVAGVVIGLIIGAALPFIAKWALAGDIAHGLFERVSP